MVTYLKDHKETNNNVKYSYLLDNMSEISGKISGISILIMVFFVTFNVVTRGMFNWSIPGFYEILSLLGAILYSFGLVYAAIKGQHIVMDLVINRVPEKLRNICDILVRMIVVLFCCLFAYAGIDITLGMLNEKTFDIRIPVAPFRFIVVSAFIMLALLILVGKNIGKGGEK